MFINCSISNSVDYDLYYSDLKGGNSHATTLNTTFDKTKVYYGDTLSSLTVNWFMHVNVIYYNGSAVSYADVLINNTFGATEYDGSADSDGWVRWVVANEYTEIDLDGDHVGNRFYFTPHEVTASDGNLSGSDDPNMNVSKVVLIILGAPLPILPPSNLTTKIINNRTSVELEWEPPSSPALDHYLIYRADSATGFNFTSIYNSSSTWTDPLNTTWMDPDPDVTNLDGDLYYIVRAANSDESDVSSTSNTAGIWTRTFQPGISTFSLPLGPFMKHDVAYYCQKMNAGYIKWMNTTTHSWMRHENGSLENITLMEVGKGYEIKFNDKTRFMFTGLPGTMIIYDNVSIGFDATPLSGNADSLTAVVDPSNSNVNLTWGAAVGIDSYYVYNSTKRDGFFGTLGVDYFLLTTSTLGNEFCTHPNAAVVGSEQYYMVVPFISGTGEKGVSSYSIGVCTAGYLDQYDTLALPLKPSNYETIDWFCDNIPDTVGINYFDVTAQRWIWHSTEMPEGAFDVIVEMGVGYQISTSGPTKFTFIGV
jgi:hypothetical protein